MADKIIFDYTEDTTPARTDNVLLQPNASTVYSRATIANILGALQAADIPDISASYVPVTPQSNVYYVGKHGNDSEDGLTIEKAKLTFSNAMSAASSGDAIVCFDNGTYAEGITAKDGVNIFAPNATLNVTGSQLVAAASTIQFNKITRTTGSNAMVIFNGATSVRQKVIANVVDDEGDGVAFRFTNASIPIVHVKEFYVSGGGIGIGDFISAEHYHVVIDDLYMNSNNAIGVQCNALSNFGVATIQHILDLGFTGTVGIDVNAGSLALISQEISADTAWDVDSGATLNVVACTVTGTKLNNGTANSLIVDDQTTEATLILPADAGNPAGTNGAEATTANSTGTAAILLSVLAYDFGSNESASWSFVAPANFVSLDSIDVLWYVNATTGDVDWDVSIAALSDGDDIAAATVDTANSADNNAVPGTANQQETTNVTITNDDSIAAGDLVYILLQRDASNDTCAADVNVTALRVRMTVNV